jgi:hypothetical protein
VIGDPRNDSNLLISGLHAAFLQFHNRAVDATRRAGEDPLDSFQRARELTVWHWQWLVVNRVLPNFVGRRVVRRILRHGPRSYDAQHGGFVPVEFSGAAYRFGHSMVRPSYRANLAGDGGGPFFAMIFDPAGEGQPDPVDLRGGARAPRRFIGWQTFFDFGDGNVKPNKKIDTRISTPLFDLPLGAIASHDQPQVLPQRNLLRQLTWSLPSGQKVAQAMRLPALTEEELGTDLDEYRSSSYDFKTSTPLWHYVLKEAEVKAGGLTLGPVGGRIVGEVLVGLIRSDPSSYLAREPRWTPTLTSAGANFRMTDFLTFAGVDPSSRGQ